MSGHHASSHSVTQGLLCWFWAQAGATGAGCLCEGMDGDGDLRRGLQDWLSSLPRRRLEEDAECRRLQESVSVLVGPSSRHTREQIRRLLFCWQDTIAAAWEVNGVLDGRTPFEQVGWLMVSSMTQLSRVAPRSVRLGSVI